MALQVEHVAEPRPQNVRQAVERSELIDVRFLESMDRVRACESARLVLARVRDVQRHRATLAGRLSIEEWLLYIAEQHVPSGSIAHLQKTDPAEWSRQFRAWADSHDPNTPVLSDEAMSRESIYTDRL